MHYSIFLITSPGTTTEVNKVHVHNYSTIASVYHIRRKHIHESMRVHCTAERVLHCIVPV